MAKRRIYEIAKERGLVTQDLADLLRSAGIEVKSNLASVEESDVDRVLAPAASKKQPAKTDAAAPEGVAPGESAAKEPGPKEAAPKEPARKDADSKVAAPPKKPSVKEPGPLVAVAAETAAPKAAKPTTEPRAAKTAPAAQGPEDEVSDASATQGARAEESRPGAVEAAASRPSQGEADARASRPGPQPARRPAPGGSRPRGRNLRLDELPTVVGPNVPLRKGVKPSGTVHRKGEEPPVVAPKPAAETAGEQRGGSRPASSGGGQRPAGGGGGFRPSGPAGSPGPGRHPDDNRPPRPGERPAAGRPAAGARPAGGAPERHRTREDEERLHGAKPVAPAAGVTEDAAGRKAAGTAAPSRVRRGDDRPARRRVVIDSQAGRKGAKGPQAGRRGGPVAEADKVPAKRKAPPGAETPVTVPSGATVKDFADALEMSPTEIIKTMMKLGEMVTITQSLSDDAMAILADEFERMVEIRHAEEETDEVTFADEEADLSERAPVVTIMGHVDHGKTSLLDAIRETEVAASEAGGITQHIGAYQVHHKDRTVTFIDTPGHEAFTAMRARGAKVTDIAVIVVAANDGVMPQSVEAIDHAKAAEVPIVVAINKIDLPDANPEKVKQQLTEHGLVAEEWGGDTVMVNVSAKQRTNLDELMDVLLLVADVQELKANPKAPASGVVVEAELDVGRGPVATVLVQRGTLHVGDAITSGESYGRVKAMFDFKGDPVDFAAPATPVLILGFNSVPNVGDFAMVVKDERAARHRAEGRTARVRMEMNAKGRGGTTLDDFYRRLKEGEAKELALVVKGDVAGSVEALEEALNGVSHPEVNVQVIHSGVGGINESDVMLAAASQAIVIGFNVRPNAAAKTVADMEGVDVRTYGVIYKVIEDVKSALIGMLAPTYVEEELGEAEVRQVFKASKLGNIAGCYVTRGKVTRNAQVRVVREGTVVYDGKLASLHRFKEDVREVEEGYECGILLEDFNDIKEGDVLEFYETKEVKPSS